MDPFLRRNSIFTANRNHSKMLTETTTTTNGNLSNHHYSGPTGGDPIYWPPQPSLVLIQSRAHIRKDTIPNRFSFISDMIPSCPCVARFLLLPVLIMVSEMTLGDGIRSVVIVAAHVPKAIRDQQEKSPARTRRYRVAELSYLVLYRDGMGRPVCCKHLGG